MYLQCGLSSLGLFEQRRRLPLLSCALAVTGAQNCPTLLTGRSFIVPPPPAQSASARARTAVTIAIAFFIFVLTMKVSWPTMTPVSEKRVPYHHPHASASSRFYFVRSNHQVVNAAIAAHNGLKINGKNTGSRGVSSAQLPNRES